MAQQDQWQQEATPAAAAEPDGGISRLEAALARIAAAAGRKQDELRVAELTARAAQHEADLLAQSHALAAAEAAALPAAAPGMTQDELQALAARLDLMIATVRSVVVVPGSEAAESDASVPESGP
ncbi:hypothetical protein [Lichenicola sp.]|uniref:hypothetical protein n=1 Tax=Lichenicola sp. TaxID=2804529 RepID=UPI003B00E8C9